MRRFSAVIFDFDGTVADTAADVWCSVRCGFAACGLTLPDGFAADNRNLAYSVAEMVKMLHPDAPAEAAAQADMATTQHYRDLSGYENTKMYHGVAKLLAALRAAGIPTGILSNKGDCSLSRILDTKGWRELFTSSRGTRDGDPQEKTARLRAYLPAFDTQNAVYIGDSEWDVTAARDNGLFSVGVLYGDGDRDAMRRACPDVLCETDMDLYHYFMEGV